MKIQGIFFFLGVATCFGKDFFVSFSSRCSAALW